LVFKTEDEDTTTLWFAGTGATTLDERRSMEVNDVPEVEEATHSSSLDHRGVEEADGIYHWRTPYVAMEALSPPSSSHPPQDDDDEISSVASADGIYDVPGFLCVCMVILIGDMSRGIFFPSMWPLVESLDGTKVLLGYAVAAFSLGRILVNPLFGNWSHRYGYSKVLLLSCIILCFGTLLYAQVQNVGHLEFLIVAQTVLGIGSGTLGVTRAFVADVTARRNRTTYMGLITAVQYGGFTVTPALGSWFNRLLQDREIFWFGGLLRINMYTAPAYCMSLIVVSTIIVLLMFFQDRERIDTVKETKKPHGKRQVLEEYANEKVALAGGYLYLTIYDLCILGCMLLNVATKGSIASFETLGIAIAEEYFDMSSSRAGFIIAACGLCGVVALLHLGILERNFTDVYIIAGGMVVMISGICGLLIIDASGAVGRSDWGYVLSMFLIYGVGYPIGHTAVIGLFSKSTCAFQNGFLQSCLPDTTSFSHLYSFFGSCRSSTPGRIARLVCFGRLLGPNSISHHVWLHCLLQFHGNLVCRPYGGPAAFHRFHSDGPPYIDVAGVLTNATWCAYSFVQSARLMAKQWCQ
jgi:MFS transporter, ceroid-lipofuscinosis neuronal protein 7